MQLSIFVSPTAWERTVVVEKIFEYVKMTISSRPRGSVISPRRFDFFV